MDTSGDSLVYEGANFFRQRLILSTLSGKPVRIKNIRLKGDEPGLKDYEANFIRLLDRLCNGSHIEVNETGTSVLYKPGVLLGGTVEHNCSNRRGIGYYLEAVFMLAPFCKMPVAITLRGVTNNDEDPSVDMIRASVVPVLKNFLGASDGFQFNFVRRGIPPGGDGEVRVRCPVKRNLNPFQWLEAGKIKQIRGVAYSSRVAPAVSTRMLNAAKEVFSNYMTNVYFSVDNGKGRSPGYGLCAVAKTGKGTVFSAEAMSNHPEGGSDVKLPEEVGKEAAWRLLEEIYRGGCVDSTSQPLVLLYMALTAKDVSKIVLGPLTPYSMHFLRHLRDFFKVTFKIDEYQEPNVSLAEEEEHDEEGRTGAKKLLLTCVGVGFTNISKGQI